MTLCRDFLYPGSFSVKILRDVCYESADNRHKYKANFLWWFLTTLRVFIVCEANYSYQFCYLMKNCSDDIQSEERADHKKTHEERTDNLC